MLCKGNYILLNDGGVILTDEEEKYVIEVEENDEHKPLPWKSALYSLIFPGLGQMYNGDFSRGSYYFVIAFILIVAAYLLLPILILGIFWLYNVYQAFNFARNYQTGTKN